MARSEPSLAENRSLHQCHLTFLQISINFNKSQILTQTEQVRLGGWKMAGGCAMTAVLPPSSWPLGKAVCRPWAIDFPKGFLFRFLASKNEKPLWLEEWKLKCFNWVNKNTKSQHFV